MSDNSKNSARDRARQLDAILAIMSLYYGHSLQSSIVKIYHDMLAEYPIEQIKAACRDRITVSPFFPKISDILEAIKKQRPPPVSLESRAQQQWQIVMDAVQRRGLNAGPPAFDDPITTALVAYQFTWARLCNLNSADLQWEEKRWSEAFALAAERSADQLAPPAPAKVIKLADMATRRITDHSDAPGDQDNTRTAGAFKSFRRLRQSGPVDREKRLEWLKKQAQDLITSNPGDSST